MDLIIHRSKAVRAILIVAALLLFPYLGFILGNSLAQAYSEGSFVNWHSLGKTPGGVVNIIGGNPWTVWLEADDGEIYEGDIEECRKHEPGCWKESESIDTYYYSEKGFECKSGFEKMKSPPVSVMQCFSVIDMGAEWYGVTHYALLQDSSIWYWKHSLSGLFVSVHDLILFSGVVVGLGMGLFVSLIIFLYTGKPRNPISG